MKRAILVAVGALLVLAPALAAAQSAGGGSDTGRTAWGDPDLQGFWTNKTTTPMERPGEYAGRASLSDEERAELDALAESYRDRAPPPGSTGAYNSFWVERGQRSSQTSLVVDPPDGQLPALTDRVRERDAQVAAARNAAPDNFTDLNLYDRCITRGLPGAMIPGFYNHNYQILQTPDHVVILVEMIHDARIVPLEGRSHGPSGVGQWLGNSRARWEGDTLVVETTGFSPGHDERAISNGLYLVHASGAELHLVERFTRIDADTIDYRFTVNDPLTYARPWTASIPMSRIDGPLYEYACHEGNYGLENILRGARNAERAEAASK